MKKKTTVQSINKHSTPPSEETKIQKHEVPGLMTLSDSILSGAVVEYRKAGYSFARHLHTNIEIYRILSGECYMDIQSETIHSGIQPEISYIFHFLSKCLTLIIQIRHS